MKTVCSYCNKTISKSPHTLKVYQHSYCDRNCYWNFRREKWTYPPRKIQKKSLFQRLIQRFGGASNENKENQKVPSKDSQGQIIDSRTTNSTVENP
jgi:hypothetical protein